MTNETFIPVKAVSGAGSMSARFKHEVKLNYLPERDANTLLHGDVHAEVEFHFLNKATGDVDNLLKSTFDVLKGSLIHDDRQIKSVMATIKEKSQRQGIKIRLSPLTLSEATKVDVVEATATLVTKKPRRKKKRKVTKKWWRIW